jgi:hypothetical protein
VASPLKKKLILGFFALVLLVLIGVGTLAYSLTFQVELEFAQDPNAVELHEANRKLKLFNEAQSAQRQGFVRFSEVEINSFLNERYNSRTNEPAQLVKSSVLLTATNLTFVTWHRIPVFGVKLPVQWQRVVRPVQEKEIWSFPVEQMRVGKVEVPKRFWPRVERFLGGSNNTFQERKVWLARIPTILLTRNELSRSPELRLYTYVPKDKGGE